MEFFKRNKITIIVGVIFFIVMIGSAVTVIHLLYPDSKKSAYGNRLDGIEDVPVENEQVEKIKNALDETGKVNEVSYHLEGRLINFIIDVKKETDKTSAKSLSDKVLAGFTDEQKNFYDIELFVVCNEDEESEIFPIIGYKHKTTVNFVWTNK